MEKSNKIHPAIYVSHAWGGESEVIVHKIVERFEREGINLILDKKDLGYRQSIGQFMLNLGKADAIILVISNKYLHSEYCMFELLQIYESDNINQRIFPIVLDEVKIAKSTERLDLVRYWEDQTTQLEEKIRELQSLSHIEGITDDLNLYHNIRNKIAKLTSILKDINTLNVKLHEESDFSELVNAVKSKVLQNEIANPKINKEQEKGTPLALSNSVRQPKKRKTKRFFFLLVPIILLVGSGYWAGKKYLMGNKNQSSLNLGSPNNVEGDENAVTNTLSDSLTISIDDKVDANQTENLQRKESTELNAETEDDKKNTPREIVSSERTKDSKSVQESMKDDQKPEEDDHVSISEQIAEPTLSKDDSPKSLKEIRIPNQLVEGEFISSISSDKVEKGDVFYLKVVNPIIADGVEVIKKGARIKAMVTKVKSSKSGGRASLGVSFESIEAINGEWLILQYPELSDIKRSEIVFKKGLKISKLRLKESIIKILQ